MKTLIRKGVINTLAATAGNLHTDSVLGTSMIVADDSADPLVPILPFEIKAKSVKDVRYVAGAEEVVRTWAVGAIIEEVIVISTKYAIDIDYAQYKQNSSRRGVAYKYGYTSPAALTGNAATDRFNVYTALNDKINNHVGNFVTSKLLTKLVVTDAAGDLNEVRVGDQVFQTDSTEAAADFKGKVAYVSSTWTAGANAIYLYDVSGTLDGATADAIQVGNYVTGDGSSLETIATGAGNSIVLGQGLFIEDDVNYWISQEGRPGASSIDLNAGFVLTTAAIGQDFTYAQGQGDVMLAQKPVFNYKADDIISGDIENTWNQDPEAAKSYTLAIMEIEGAFEPTAGANNYAGQKIELHLYMDESDGTNLTNLKNALTALIGL